MSKSVVWVSFLILYLELALIRFMPAHILYLGFFTNFVLIASFLGIGLGLILSNIKINLINYFPWLFLGLVIVTQIFSTGLNIDTSDVIFFRDELFDEQPIAIPGFILLPFLFICVAVVFASLAQILGRFFTQSKNPVRTYALDILGSILGIICFFIVSSLSFPPPVWFAIFAFVFCLGTVTKFKKLLILILVFTLIVILSFDFGKEQFFWSPYYRITLIEDQKHSGGLILANNIHHQYFARLEYTPLYTLVFSRLKGLAPLNQVLIIGSGSGQDVAAALQAGAKHVTAIEIDPSILNIGKKLHPLNPYSDPRVTIINDDGRNYLRNTDQKFDVIIYALTDSLVLNFGLSEIRLESFLFTQESFQDARNHLREGGVFAMYNDYRKDWLIDRLEKMLIFVFGNSVNKFDLGGNIRMFEAKPSLKNIGSFSNSELPKDDWPFLYLRKPSIPAYYIWIILSIVSVSVLSIGFTLKLVKGIQRPIFGRLVSFFFLGAAFALLETKSIVQLNLLFGVTWNVNVLAFIGILLTVLFACFITMKVRIHRIWFLVILLILSLILQYLIPINNLLFDSPILRFFIAVPFFYLPIFFANLIFANMLSQSREAQLDFAANLLGLVFGGIVEYAALITGYSNLAILAGIFYLLALLYLK